MKLISKQQKNRVDTKTPTASPGRQRFDVLAAILRDIGTPMRGRVLDLGCGDGALVQSALDRGLDAYGCDFEEGSFIKTTSVLSDMATTGRLRHISPESYRLPFEDGAFDVVFSDQVFEHVQNYPETLAEVARVTRPGGCSLHLFPSRTRLIEGHMLIPFGGVFRPRWWLWLWARLGVRNRYQRGMSVKEVVQQNVEWLPTYTNYLKAAEIRAHFNRYFARVEFVERHFLKHSRRAKVLRFTPAVYRAFGSRVVYARK